MKPKQPNILVIMSDQHHAAVMGCAGDTVAQTPNLDRLASQGVRFSNAYCACPLCGPSRMSFMTGKHPHEINQWDNQNVLDSDIPTFADSFASAGYDTVLSGRMHFVGGDQRHGFTERLIGDVSPTAYIMAGWQLEKVVGDLVDTCGMSLSGIKKSGPGRTGYQAYDEAVTATTVDWLQERGQGDAANPFLLTVGYVTPHCPFVAPPDDFEYYRDKISLSDLPQPDEQMHPRNAKLRRGFGVDPIPPLDAQWRTRVAYYGLTTFMDRQVGAVLDALEASGQAGNTIVVYCSDHGEALGEHGMWWKSTFYDGSSRIPLIVSLPGQQETVRTENVSLMDVGTTLLDMSGLDSVPDISGRSFRCLLCDRREPGEISRQARDDTGEGAGCHSERSRGISQDADGSWDDTAYAEYAVGTLCRMVRSGPWKYNYYHEMQPELFNLHDDPGEVQNLAGKEELCETEARLRALVLSDWNPDEVRGRVERAREETRAIAERVKAARPPEPDPPWFSDTPDNWVDDTITPSKERVGDA